MTIVTYVLFGALIGVLSGFMGIGGGFILTPTLLLTGVSPLAAITTSLSYTIGTSASGVYAHFKRKNIYWKEGLVLGISGIVATQVARPIVIYMNSKGWDDVLVPILYIGTLLFFIYKMLIKKPVTFEKPTEKEATGKVIVKLMAIGFTAGVASTTLGVGGGFIIVPLSIAFLGMDSRKAVGTSLFAIFMIVSAGFFSYALTIAIDYQVALFLIIGGLIGSQFGARLTEYYESREIERLLATLYMATLLSVVAKLFNLNTIGISVLFIFLGYFIIQALIRILKIRKTTAEETEG